MIQTCRYKDRPAIAVSNGNLKAVFLPEDGGKMASLYDGIREYLAQNPGNIYQRLLPNGDYVSAECSGFDDMFPTIDPYTPSSGMYRGVAYPDHGEVCRYPMNVEQDVEAVTFTFQSKRFQVRWQKRICCEDGGFGIRYTIENYGTEDFPYIWAAHCMIKAEPDARILTPYEQSAEKQVMFGNFRHPDRTETYDPAGESYKYYYKDPICQGWCGYRYGDGRTLMFRYPAEILGYLGVWINNGSFKSMYNIALEPCSAPYDRPDVATDRGYCSVLKPGQTVQFRLLVTIEDRR